MAVCTVFIITHYCEGCWQFWNRQRFYRTILDAGQRACFEYRGHFNQPTTSCRATSKACETRCTQYVLTHRRFLPRHGQPGQRGQWHITILHLALSLSHTHKYKYKGKKTHSDPLCTESIFICRLCTKKMKFKIIFRKH